MFYKAKSPYIPIAIQPVMDRTKKETDQAMDPDEKSGKKRSRLIKWILNIIDSIITALT